MDTDKIYVDVTVSIDKSGIMRPRSLVWEDGVRYRIERVSDVRQARAMRCGGQGDRYTIWVNGQMSYLYFERVPLNSGTVIGKWFVERKQ